MPLLCSCLVSGQQRGHLTTAQATHLPHQAPACGGGLNASLYSCEAGRASNAWRAIVCHEAKDMPLGSAHCRECT